MPLGRPAANLAKSGCASPLPAAQARFFGGGLFRVAAPADHWLISELLDAAVPFDCELLERAVEVDELDEVEETEEEELVRERVLRGANMPLPSSGLVELCPSIEPHAGRDN